MSIYFFDSDSTLNIYILLYFSIGSMYIHIGTYIHSPADDDAVVRISMTLHFDIRYVVRK